MSGFERLFGKQKISAIFVLAILAGLIVSMGVLSFWEARSAGDTQRSLRSIGLILPSIAVLAWSYKLLALAERARGLRFRIKAWLFVAALLFLILLAPVLGGLFLSLEMGVGPPFPIVAFVAGVLTPVCVGITTHAFLTAAGDDNSPFHFFPFGLTFLGIFFLPLGIWFLRDRIARLSAAAAGSSPAAS